jgi:lipoate-protein ligase A
VVSCRLLPYALANGPHNMALDEVMLEAATDGEASLRFYGWTAATVSLGYFQSQRVRLADQQLAGLPFVRRPTGGAMLIHHHEVTYALALPVGAPWHDGEPWLRRMHGIISTVLGQFRVRAEFHDSACQPPFSGVLCFQHRTCGDLLIGPAKVVGSAQRKQRGALLQHGAILLAQSSFAPELPGIRELSGLSLTPEEVCSAISVEFARQTSWALVPTDWIPAQRLRAKEFAVSKYSQDKWNQRR